jgi:Glutathione peroxidase
MIDRRTVVTAALAAIVAPGSTRGALAQASMSRITAYAFSFPALAGDDIRLAEYAGHPVMVVNTASLCGYTPQYAGLQELWTEFHDRGLAIVGVPSNDFGGADGTTPLWRHVSDRGKGRGGRAEGASVLQMGCGSAAEGCAALELSQISGRPRRLPCGGVPVRGRADRYKGQDRHRKGASRHLTELNLSTDNSAALPVQPLPWRGRSN